MKKLGTLIIFFQCFCFLSCHMDSGSKKYPHSKQVISKSVTSNYNPSIDVLFVIDNSGSMGSFQINLARNAELFIDRFLSTEFIDYHIAVTTSSYGPLKSLWTKESPDDILPPPYATDGDLAICKNLAEKTGYPYKNYVDKNTPQGSQCLKEMMKVGVKSQTDEFFFNIIILSLSGLMSMKNSDFYRPEAHLAVFIVTDSFDQSNTPYKEAYEFLLHLKKGDEKKLHYAAAIITREMREYGCVADGGPNTDFVRMAKLFGSRGYIFSLCQFDYGKELAHFADHLVDSALTIPLDSLPNMDSIEVYYKNEIGKQLIPKGSNGWTYDGENNVVRLSRNIQLDGKKEGEFIFKYEPFYTPQLENL